MCTGPNKPFQLVGMLIGRGPWIILTDEQYEVIESNAFSDEPEDSETEQWTWAFE